MYSHIANTLITSIYFQQIITCNNVDIHFYEEIVILIKNQFAVFRFAFIISVPVLNQCVTSE